MSKPDPQRRRLTVSQCDSAVASASAGGGNHTNQIQEYLDSKTNMCIFLASVTDKDRKTKRSFADKDQIELVNKNQNAKKNKEWLKSLGIAYACKKGLKPESPNQDSFLTLAVENEFAVYGVFDGHGPNGHDVSDTAQKFCLLEFLNSPDRDKNTGNALKNAFVNTQNMLEGLKTIDCTTSGATGTMVYHDLVGKTITVAHVGDSRCILSGPVPDSKKPVTELTIDHKPNLPEEKKRIEESNPPGRVVFDGFYNHRVFAKNGMYPGLNMSRALGDVIAHKEAGLIAEPDIKTVDVSASAEWTLVVATDGVWEFIDSDNAMKLVNSSDGIDKAVETLTTESWNKWMADSDNEISDDITAVIVKLDKVQAHTR